MLFFRLNKTTIEVIEQEDDLPPGDKMWGLAWDVKDIKKAHQRLLDEGIEVTPIQKGVKEKTLVATVKITYPKCSNASYSAFRLEEPNLLFLDPSCNMLSIPLA